jgi:hypothetical protein
MALVTSAQPYVFGESFRDNSIILVGVYLNGGTVVTEQFINGAWRSTGDTYGTDGTYQLTTGGGGVKLRIVCAGDAVVETPQ